MKTDFTGARCFLDSTTLAFKVLISLKDDSTALELVRCLAAFFEGWSLLMTVYI